MTMPARQRPLFTPRSDMGVESTAIRGDVASDIASDVASEVTSDVTNSSGATPRYAIYLAPVQGWARAGTRWLGRDADTGLAISRGIADDRTGSTSAPANPSTGTSTSTSTSTPTSASLDAAIDTWTAAPRLYGLHATLKPPFRLAEGKSPEALDIAVRDLARRFAPFDLPLHLTRLRGFLAWCAPAEPPPQLQELADRCVVALDAFRAPPSPAELERRRAAPLTPAHERQLARWGYPYVFDTFTFHITLSGKLDDVTLDTAQATLARLDPPTDGQAMPVNAISVFVQKDAGEPFVVARHYRFDGSVEDGASAASLRTPQ